MTLRIGMNSLLNAAKAFDVVWQDSLLRKICRKCVNGKF